MRLLLGDPEDAIQCKRKIRIFDFEEANPNGGRHGVSGIGNRRQFPIVRGRIGAYLHSGCFIVASYGQKEERD